jgi:hypothetical protein
MRRDSRSETGSAAQQGRLPTELDHLLATAIAAKFCEPDSLSFGTKSFPGRGMPG